MQVTKLETKHKCRFVRQNVLYMKAERCQTKPGPNRLWTTFSLDQSWTFSWTDPGHFLILAGLRLVFLDLKSDAGTTQKFASEVVVSFSRSGYCIERLVLRVMTGPRPWFAAALRKAMRRLKVVNRCWARCGSGNPCVASLCNLLFQDVAQRRTYIRTMSRKCNDMRRRTRSEMQEPAYTHACMHTCQYLADEQHASCTSTF